MGLTRGLGLRPRRTWESWEAPGSLGREPCNLAERLIWLHWVLLEGSREESPRRCEALYEGVCGGVSPEHGDEQEELHPRRRQCPTLALPERPSAVLGPWCPYPQPWLLVALSREHHCLLVASWPPCVGRGHGGSRAHPSWFASS